MKFSTMFHIPSTVKNNVKKERKHKTKIKWDSHRSEELVLT